MLEIEITRLIASAVAALLFGYACYVAAYVKHKNAIRDEINKKAVATKVMTGINPIISGDDKIRIEKTKTWYMGYRLALVGLMIVSTAVGWAVGWAVGQDHVLTWVEDAAVAAAAAVIGGFTLDKYIIHPIADGSFFEKVEDPLVQRFLSDAVADPVPVKRSLFGFLKRKKKQEAPAEAPAEEAPAAGIEGMSFEEKIKLLELLKKSL